MLTAAQPHVLLAETEDGPGYCLTVMPPPAGPGHDKCFASYLHARAYARLLKFGHGWKVVDRVDAKTIKAAEEADRVRRDG